MDKKKRIYDFISSLSLMVIATASLAVTPEAAAIGFAVTDDMTVVFSTQETTRKYSNIETNPRVALVIGGEDGVTVQMQGQAKELTSDEQDLKEIYFAKHPSARRYMGTATHFFKVTPSWMRFLDTRQHPPETFEITV